MSKLALHGSNGKKVKDIDVPDALLAGPIRKGLLYYMVRHQLAGKRAGTHATKTRGMVAGSTKKIYRQKGTGNARHGDIKAPIFVGGGRVFGPHPRDYSYNLPKTARKRGLQTALALKNKEGKLLLTEKPGWKSMKTKQAVEFFKALQCPSALLVIGESDPAIERSVRNLKNFKVLRADGLNVYDILKFDYLVMTEEALSRTHERLGLGNEVGGE